MKIVIAVFLFCAVQTKIDAGGSCPDMENRWQSCLMKNNLFNTLEGFGMTSIRDMCKSTSTGTYLQLAGQCISNLITECNFREYFDMEKLGTVATRICKVLNSTGDNCDVTKSGLTTCITNKRLQWDKATGKMDKEERMKNICDLNGGIKSCIRENLQMTCTAGEQYEDLLQTFSKKKCMEYMDCRICGMSGSSTLTASLAIIAGSFLLYTIF